jgi:diacylglycerol kinase family enzyme
LRIETPEPTAINIDGENVGSTPIHMEVLPSEVKIFY